MLIEKPVRVKLRKQGEVVERYAATVARDGQILSSSRNVKRSALLTKKQVDASIDWAQRYNDKQRNKDEVLVLTVEE